MALSKRINLEMVAQGKCGSLKSDRSGYCTSSILYPNGRCGAHGGTTPSGINSPHIRHGRHSKHLPERIAEKVLNAIQDPQLTTLAPELALLDARAAELEERLHPESGAQLWDEARKAYRGALDNGAEEEARVAAMKTLGRILEQGAAEGAVWAELYDIVDRRRKLIVAESRRQQQLQNFLPATQVQVLVMSLLAAVRERVPDRRIREMIGNDFRRLIALPNGSHYSNDTLTPTDDE